MPRLALLFGLLLSLTGNAHAVDLATRCEIASVPQWQWVNPVGKKMPRESCGIEFGGTITVVAADAEGVLVQYTHPGVARGTACPAGVEFLLSHEQFRAMAVDAVRVKDEQRHLQERLERLQHQRE
jgi:hypothetical protein